MTNKKSTKSQPQKPVQDKPDDMMTETPVNGNGKDGVMLQLGGLWVNESKSGTKYMAGYLGNLKLVIFRNNYKQEDKHPDYVMYVAEKPRDNADSTSEPEQKDDIPF